MPHGTHPVLAGIRQSRLSVYWVATLHRARHRALIPPTPDIAATMTTTTIKRKKIDLGLQGGGAHGAFTWGVLHRLLQEQELDIVGISGTSAGAMNAVVLADGLAKDGRDGAIAALANFWRGVSNLGLLSPFKRTPWDVLFGRWSLDSSPYYALFDMMSHLVSPYDINPLNINPLRNLLEDAVDFERLRSSRQLKLFVTATNVRSGAARVFERKELTADTVMASACLPYLFQAVEIDGEAYWDGGYTGNPSLFPLIHDTRADDLLIVQVNPLQRDEVPEDTRAILNRINEITFNASLIKELRGVALLGRLARRNEVLDERYRELNVHLIHGESCLERMSASSKMNTEWAFFELLHDIGFDVASNWLAENGEHIGQKSTLDFGDALFRWTD